MYVIGKMHCVEANVMYLIGIDNSLFFWTFMCRLHLFTDCGVAHDGNTVTRMLLLAWSSLAVCVDIVPYRGRKVYAL